MTRKILNALIVALLAYTACSCSSLKGKSTAISGDSGTVSEAGTGTPVVTYPDRSSGSTTLTKAESPTAGSPLSGQMAGEWTITAAGKYHIQQDEDMPYIYFDESDGRFYASNGCNVLNGDFKADAQSNVTFSNVLSTMADCPDLAYLKDINSALRDGSSVKMKVETDGKATIAYLMSKSGTKLLTLRRHNTDELNGKWRVSQIEALKVDDDQVNIFLDIPEKSIHGNTGCNYFNGQITVDPEKANSISFSQMAVTMKACPNSDVEMAMLVALEETASYSLSGSTLRLLSARGKTVMTLVRE
ncbi:MAG: META domain-containing protein [Bacteroidales bacterium]|nr:META domain-containing protein [Bacteroidales bacterium]